MSARANSVGYGVQGNKDGLLRDADNKRTGTGTCKSDTLDLFQKHWIRTNVSGLLRVVMAEDKSELGVPVDVFMNAGIASEFVVRRILVTGSTAIGPADIVLLA
jgi:hypothetical protein